MVFEWDMLVYWGERKEMICENESEMMGWRKRKKIFEWSSEELRYFMRSREP